MSVALHCHISHKNMLHSISTAIVWFTFCGFPAGIWWWSWWMPTSARWSRWSWTTRGCPTFSTRCCVESNTYMPQASFTGWGFLIYCSGFSLISRLLRTQQLRISGKCTHLLRGQDLIRSQIHRTIKPPPPLIIHFFNDLTRVVSKDFDLCCKFFFD